MCRTIQSCLQTFVCMFQMLIRILMTTVLMFENLLRLFMQTVYNMLSFIAQLLSLIPICCVFVLTSKMKGMICGTKSAGGQSGGGMCDCVLSTLMLVVVFHIFKEMGVLDIIMVKIGYIPAKVLKKTIINLTKPPKWQYFRRGNETETTSLSALVTTLIDDEDEGTNSPTTEFSDSISPENLTTVFYYVAR